MDYMTDAGRYDQLENKLIGALEAVESIIQEKLDNYGIYYRMFARIKKGESIRKKLSLPRYQEDPDKKLQDLLGIRIVLYYEDDIEVCKRIFENILEQYAGAEKDCNNYWEQYTSSDTTFSATKINGVFELPGFIRRLVVPEIEGLRVEPTFEIQLRTMFFEGWHEVEHDLRYKNQALWDEFPRESRKLNSVLATLELCDQYMITLFDDIGHGFYKVENWGEMLRYKYRLKSLNGDMDEELEKLLTVDLAKKIFKWKKEELIDMALERKFNVVDANVIVYLVNESVKGDKAYCPAIAERFDALYQERKQKRWVPSERDRIAKLRQEKAFEATVTLYMDGKPKEQVFREAAECIYKELLCEKLGDALQDEFSKPMHPFAVMVNGIIVKFSYDLDDCVLVTDLSFVDLEDSSKIRNLYININEQDGRLVLRCLHSRMVSKNAPRTIMQFIKPITYTNLAKEIGVVDVEKLRSKVQLLKETEIEQFVRLLQNPERRFPVILISYPNEEERFKKNSCYGRLVDYATNPKVSDQTHLMRKIAYISHVYCVTGAAADKIAKMLGEASADFVNGIRFFGKGFTLAEKENYQSFNEKEVLEHPKDTYALHSRPPYCYMSVSGADAARHEVILLVCQDILR